MAYPLIRMLYFGERLDALICKPAFGDNSNGTGVSCVGLLTVLGRYIMGFVDFETKYDTLHP